MNSMRLFDVPYHQQKNYQKDTMFVTKKEGIWTPMDTTTFIEKALLVSRGLIAFGISAGDKIAVASTNRVEWNILDIAVQQVGAILVPLYPNISVNDYRFILNDSSTRICVVGNKELWDKISSIRKDVSSLEHLFVFDDIEGCSHWSEISEKAEKTDLSEVKSRMDLVKSGDLVTIIYTSGTTGNPKGVMLSHSNILSNVFACKSRIPANNNSNVLSFLPVCHIYERMLHYLYMYIGCSIYFGESMETIGENIREVKPDVFSAVPRLIEKVYDKIIVKGDELSGLKKKLFFWALALAENYELKGKSPLYKIQLALARKLIFSKWKLALGGNVKAIASGSAALQPRLARIFLAAGIPILEGYGLSETSPVVTVNSFDKGICFGSVGTLIEHVEVKIAEDGEILVKGPNVMLGYYNNEEATNEVMDKDGWFHTGDIGVFIDKKFLKITDRKKEIFKTSGGKYIAPQAMENKFKESRFIEQLIVVGEGEKFPGAFIVPSFLFLKEWALQNNLNFDKLSNEELVLNEKILSKFKEEIEEINEFFGSWEQLKKFVLLPTEFSIDGGELTPTLKLKRKKIMEKYQKEYAILYGN